MLVLVLVVMVVMVVVIVVVAVVMEIATVVLVVLVVMVVVGMCLRNALPGGERCSPKWRALRNGSLRSTLVQP